MSSLSGSRQREFEVNRTYEPYSDDPDYIAGNRGFIGSLDLQSARRVLDLACGVGTLTHLIWELRPDMSVVGIDISPETLGIAKGRPERAGAPEGPDGKLDPKGRASWLAAGSAEAIPLCDSSVDAIVMGHSIHLIGDEDKLLGEVHRVLRPGGRFAFNTSFYAGTFVPGTEQVYHDWIKEALNYIQKRDRELRSRGQTGIRRIRGQVPRAFSKGWPSARDWTQRLAGHGLRTERVFTRTVTLTQYSFETIGAYAGFASVILSGYPVEIACEALQAAAGPTMAAADVDQVPRYWLEVVATKAPPG